VTIYGGIQQTCEQLLIPSEPLERDWGDGSGGNPRNINAYMEKPLIHDFDHFGFKERFQYRFLFIYGDCELPTPEGGSFLNHHPTMPTTYQP
jgi:hypothetical protein